MKPIALSALVFFFISQTLMAQELDIGFHINPDLTVPVLTKNKIANGDTGVHCLSFTTQNIGLSAGFDLKWSIRKWSVLSGIGYASKNITFINPLGYDVSNSTSLECPLIIEHEVYNHDKGLRYKVNILFGASYEYNTITGEQGGGSSSSGSLNYAFYAPLEGNSSQSCSLVGGAVIEAMIRKFGQIEYGIAFHCPVITQPNAKFYYTSAMNINGQNEDFKVAEFQPAQAYIDFRLCYHFLSIGPRFKRIRFR